MVLESVISNVSPPRPNSLCLKSSWTNLQDVSNENLKSVGKEQQSSVMRRKKKRRAAGSGVKRFDQIYESTGETLGSGSQGFVSTYKNATTGIEYAVKVVPKSSAKTRNKVLKEIEIFHHCKGHDNILQLIEYFEEEEKFYIVFEKMEGGTLLETIQRRGHLTEQEASLVVRDIARALDFLHKKGIAHRDLKPENILCVKAGQLVPVKICDFDLGSGILMNTHSRHSSPITTPELLTPVGSAEYMAPEVVDVWQDQAWSYDKRCDVWSLGIILFMLLCGYPPFYGQCGNDCGWERGEECRTCQDMLFNKIQDGEFTFPQEEWRTVSADAMDLIRHMLVRDPRKRYAAYEVLKHRWVAQESSRQQLATPRILQRTNSIKGLEAFADNANAFNRLLLNHLSMSSAPYHAGSAALFSVGDVPWEELAEQCAQPRDDAPDSALPADGDYGLMFSIGGGDSSGADDELNDEASSGDDDFLDQLRRQVTSGMSLSPPGLSALAARRRMRSNSSSGDSFDLDKENLSPQKIPSAIF